MFNWFRKKPSNREAHPPFWQSYLSAFEDQPFDPRQPVSEVTFVVFDTETTGLDTQQDHILSMGAVKVRNWTVEVSSRLEIFVQQAYQPKGEVVAVHGILPGAHDASFPEPEAVKQFLSYCGSGVLVAHHAAFDITMVNKALGKLGPFRLENKVLDTGTLARRVAQHPQLARPGTYGLDQLCRQYHISPSDRHTAAGDAFITALLLMKLLYRLEKRGVHTLGSLLAAPRQGLR